jgi:hypothetical protein
MGNICCSGKEESNKNGGGTFLAVGGGNPSTNNNNNDVTDWSTTASFGGTGTLSEQQQQRMMVTGGTNNSSSVTSAAGGGGGGRSGPNSSTDLVETEVVSATAQQQQLEENVAREEAMKAKVIVQATGRAMVSVNTTRDRNTIYYSDQGFAAALGQHLEQKMLSQQPASSFAVGHHRLPPVPSSSRTGDPGTESGSNVVSSTGNNNNNNDSNRNDEIMNPNNRTYYILSQPSHWEQINFAGITHLNDGIVPALVAATGNHEQQQQQQPMMKYLDHIHEQILEKIVPKKDRLFTKTAPMIENLI